MPWPTQLEVLLLLLSSSSLSLLVVSLLLLLLLLLLSSCCWLRFGGTASRLQVVENARAGPVRRLPHPVPTKALLN